MRQPAEETTTTKRPDDNAARTLGRSIDDSLRPIPDQRFGYAQARHLLWRAGFGGTDRQVRTLVELGPERSVELIVEYDGIPFRSPSADDFDKDVMRPATSEERGAIRRARESGDESAVARFRARRQEAQRRDRQQMTRVQHWWLERMIETPRPLEEKLTLFWHGHFATSYRTIEDSYHMFKQNVFFREQACGSFASLLRGIIRDPAMLKYLDNDQSRKNRPNENLAREILELFSLGEGNYTERDIKEGARALTGYTFEDDEFRFNRRNHDASRKTILGRSGELDGDGMVDAILARRECAEFIAGKLYRYFVTDYPTGDPRIDRAAKPVVRELANTIMSREYAIRPMLKRLFLSRHFYEPEVMGEQIKSPAQLVVGAVRSLQTPVRDLSVLADAMNLMGQNLFFPPSVKGWDGGRSWINTSTMFIRQNILAFLLTGKTPTGYDPLAGEESFEPSGLFRGLSTEERRDAGAVVEHVLRVCLPSSRGIDVASTRRTLTGYVDRSGGRISDRTVTDLLLLATATPGYQLC